MGTKFYLNAVDQKPMIEPLAPEILKKCKEKIDDYKKFLAMDTPKHVIFNLVCKILIPSLNYAPFIDTDDG